MDFTKLTKTDLNKIDQSEIMDLEMNEWLQYREKSKEVGNIYYYNGISKFTPILYGTDTKRLTFNPNVNEWEIGIATVPPETNIKPLLVNKQKFAQLMLALGVPQNTLDAFFDESKESTNLENF